MTGQAWARASLRQRLLAATLVAVVLALGVAGVLLNGLFREQAQRQFDATLRVHLDALTARLEFTPEGAPQVNTSTWADPRWNQPLSGLYWQIDALPASPKGVGMLRSRSLWDAALDAPFDALTAGTVHAHTVPGPGGEPVRLLERSVQSPGVPGTAPTPWRLMVAADTADTQHAAARFGRALALALGLLALLLGAAAWAQVSVGLAPLRALQQALAAVKDGSAVRVQGQFPHEVQPMVESLNAVLDRNEALLNRARTQAGNLAHALKTPLATLAQAASTADAADAALRTLVRDQVAQARQQVDWHLARARAAGPLAGLAQVPVAPVVAGLLRVMQRVHAERGLALTEALPPDLPAFAGEAQDLQEMIGNLLDNACKWARGHVVIQAQAVPGATPPRLRITVQDDGPGIAEPLLAQALARGQRLDERMPGDGLGLAIVQELAALYGGQLQLQRAALGGLAALLELPAAPLQPPQPRTP
jgi:signal transduction histidine kinase